MTDTTESRGLFSGVRQLRELLETIAELRRQISRITTNAELRDALTRIVGLLQATADASLLQPEPQAEESDGQPGDDMPPCSLKALPSRLLEEGSHHAIEVNPFNSPEAALGAGARGLATISPKKIAVLTAKYWGPTARRLTTSFVEATPADLRARILLHLNAWGGGIEFVPTGATGQVRISRGPTGHWSFLGTDIDLIPTSRATMNLQGFTMSTPESEFRRVVRHEAGHTLGFPHEHMRKELVDRIDPELAIEFFRRTQRWDRATVMAQVLKPLDEASIMGTHADDTSIMCYQLPGSITRDGRPIPGGTDINATDRLFMEHIYPLALKQPVAVEEDWPEEDDR